MIAKIRAVFFGYFSVHPNLCCTFVFMKLKWIALSALLLIALSCREKAQVDVKAPTIETLTINGNAENEQSVNASEPISIAYTVKDNAGIENSSFSIHAAHDGHTHTGTGSQGGEYHLTSGSWSFSETTPASGTSYSNSYEIEVPDSIGGVWHVEVTAKDEVGYSVSKAISLNVVNDNLPYISLVSAYPEVTSDGYIHAGSSSNVSLILMANDADNLAAVYFRLVNHSGTTLALDTVPVFGTTTTFPANFSQALPGEYRIIVDAFDILGYHSVWDTRLKVQ